ncbi:MAG TPA: cupin domain-containing protein [Candidatus Dormibacteraeota bacterium]|nr:cupin domain-containing protein [Candidatus Dormibacteraeota bacterium]
MLEQLWFLDGLVTTHVSAEQSADGISVLEFHARHGDSPPLHVHSEDEIFHVLEGELSIQLGDRRVRVPAGQTFVGPQGVPHSFRVESEEARWLIITARGDFERFVRSFGRIPDGPGLPPPAGTPTPQQEMALADASRKHGIEVVGPPLS